jgi:predicted Zn-dependent peptidase
MQPIKKGDLQKVDPLNACEYFSKCFRDPSAFTVVIVGNIDPTVALPLILQYLVSINPLTKSQLILNSFNIN